MIELIYNEEEKYITGEGKLSEPKNVKQIGEPREYKKIFLEDYVHTFLQQYAKEKDGQAQIAVLLGNAERAGGRRHLYIKSALPVDQVNEKHGKYIFTEKIWGEIYQQCEKYFPEQEIMGWFLAKPGFSVEKTVTIEETQRTYFSGADKVFFMLEPLEGESGFFAFDGNRFTKQPGYYIYYEKNEPMHEFLLEKKSEQEGEVQKEKPDVAVANFRKILQEKQVQSAKRKKIAISYGMKVSIALVLFVGVVTLKNQTEKIQTMEQQMSVLAGEEVVEVVSTEEVLVEEIPGDVGEQQEIVYEESVAEEAVVELPVTELEEMPENQAEESQEEERIESEPQEEETMAEVSAPEKYIVQMGDTLAKISRDKYGNDDMIERICELNGISNGDYIQVGETILLP